MKNANGSKSMEVTSKPNAENDLEAARQKVEARKIENVNSLGVNNGSKGGNIAVGGK